MVFLMFGLAWFVTGTTAAWAFGRLVQTANPDETTVLLN